MISYWYSCSLLIFLTLAQVWSFQQKSVLVRSRYLPRSIHQSGPCPLIEAKATKTQRVQNNHLHPSSVISFKQSSPTFTCPSTTAVWSTSPLLSTASLAANQHLLFSLDDTFLPTKTSIVSGYGNPSMIALATIIKVSLSIVMLYLSLHGAAFLQDVLFILGATTHNNHHHHHPWRKLSRVITKWLGRPPMTTTTHPHHKSSQHLTARSYSKSATTTSLPLPLSDADEYRRNQKPLSVSPSLIRTKTDSIKRNVLGVSTINKIAPSSSVRDAVKTATQKFPWLKCKLVGKSSIDQRYTMYSFQTTEEDKLSKKTLVGRQIILCASDKDGKLIKQPFYPLMSENTDEFQIVADNQDPPPVITAINDMDLNDLTQDDLVACKVGPSMISYHGPENQIRYLTVVASQLGIVPSLQLMQSILSQSQDKKGDFDLDIDGIELIWINDKKESFILNQAIEQLEEKFGDKFSCIRIVDKGIQSPNSVLNDKVKKILPEAEPGRVAIVAGSSTLRDKFSKALIGNQNYHVNNVISIPDPIPGSVQSL